MAEAHHCLDCNNQLYQILCHGKDWTRYSVRDKLLDDQKLAGEGSSVFVVVHKSLTIEHSYKHIGSLKVSNLEKSILTDRLLRFVDEPIYSFENLDESGGLCLQHQDEKLKHETGFSWLGVATFLFIIFGFASPFIFDGSGSNTYEDSNYRADRPR